MIRYSVRPHSILIAIMLLLVVLQGCLPSSSSGGRKNANAQSATTSDDTDTSTGDSTGPDFSADDAIIWFTDKEIPGIITIAQNIQTVIYVRGSAVNSFLDQNNNYLNTYCFVSEYTISNVTAKKQIRARAVPISFTNFSTGLVERLLRIDLPSISDNQNACSGSINGESTSIAFTPLQYCDTCTSINTASNLGIYQAEATGGISDLNLVPKELMDINKLGFRVDSQSNSGSSSELCTNSSCIAQGFNCCIEGQCVMDAVQKPNASSDPDFAQASAEIALNLNAFLDWPNIFYICPNIPRFPAPDPTPTVFPNAEATAAASFNRDKQDFYCLEEGKKGATANFGLEFCVTDPKKANQPDCEDAGGIWDFACHDAFGGSTGTQAGFEAIQNNVFDRCGCEVDPFPTPPASVEPYCPGFGLKALLDQAENITDVVCDIPLPADDPTPFQTLDVNVSGRSAPHRFFNKLDGIPVDDISNLQNELPTKEQEGTLFFYQDDSSKVTPIGDVNNINAVIGSMTIDLSNALPAKMVRVDHNQPYIIRANAGTFTPCPNCTRDAWFQSYTAFPPSQDGRGVEAIGFTTSRDAFDSNFTGGNFEDSIFGRACWVPPTMILGTHQKNPDVQVQRQDRLAAQTALWMNGYQRDWYGFNAGALIGSFDGVKWFAIGTGRRVLAKSTKLFLAMNAAYADLSEPVDLSVSIILDQGGNVAADYDFDPTKDVLDSRQNYAGTCQRYHQCETDTECVTNLGWEYRCADIQPFRTFLPTFDIDGNERANEEVKVGFNNLLYGTTGGGLPVASTKRCVYRGAGSICKQDFRPDDSDTAQLNRNVRKLFTCNHNYYCAKILDDNVFNDRIVREPENISIFTFGQDADYLGRPLSYVAGNKQLPQAARDNIAYNMTNHTSETGDIGLCRPGRTTTNNDQFDTHVLSDSAKRTDYINQIASCDSTQSGSSRVFNCPIILGDDADEENQIGQIVWPSNNGNLTDEVTGGITSSSSAERHRQNMCGSETVRAFDGVAAFEDIEADTLVEVDNLLQPTLVRDACLRRAGAVCHSNFDCGPNNLHSDTVVFKSKDFFGKTDAEKQFWSEPLICGQGEEVPQFQSLLLAEYDISQNRCCREVGETITMYTGGDTSTSGQRTRSKNIMSSLTDDDALHLDTDKFPYSNTSADGHYSRYTIAAPITNPGFTSTTPVNAQVRVEPNQSPRPFQWKTINETGRKTCCGNGFVRLFSDDTHDWNTFRTRLAMDLNSFKCLNYQTDLFVDPNADQIFVSEEDLASMYETEFSFMCMSPGEPLDLANVSDGLDGLNFGGGNSESDNKARGCIQTEIPTADNFEIVYPQDIDDSIYLRSGSYTNIKMDPRVDASQDPPTLIVFENLTHFVPYVPLDYTNALSDNLLLPGSPDIYMTDPNNDPIALFYLPAYVGGPENIKRFIVGYYDYDLGTGVKIPAADGAAGPVAAVGHIDADPALNECTDGITGTDEINPGVTILKTLMQGNTNAPRWCWHRTLDNRYAILLRAREDNNGNNTWMVAGWELEFFPPNTKDRVYTASQVQESPTYEQHMGPLVDGRGKNTAVKGLIQGNSMYYLTKLGRLELLGVPQIFYEPLVCNSNRAKIVPGIFEDGDGGAINEMNLTDSDDFVEIAFQFDDDGQEPGEIYGESLGNDPANSTGEVTFKDKVILPDVFSENKFICCRELDSKVDDTTKCCSGHGIADPNDPNLFECKLPRTTNLMVYFNRFISGEGIGEDQPGGGLEDEDFVPLTGEIQLSQASYDKISLLGQSYCDSGLVRAGGFLGNFFGEPNFGLFDHVDSDAATNQLKWAIHGAADSNVDFDFASPGQEGANTFLAGFRWNHHLYCD